MGINRMSDVYLRKITNNPKNPDHIAQKTRSYSPKTPFIQPKITRLFGIQYCPIRSVHSFLHFIKLQTS